MIPTAAMRGAELRTFNPQFPGLGSGVFGFLEEAVTVAFLAFLFAL
ncbi:Uncharacterised protein [Mycobacteroides abscessus subsp. massiliense]|nr:Uncharacterised protein [Mycobacteroides abscessus subsp. abscessus]SLI16831.1 Uncharacterised protein [Mycobacteroides abscessus subsp. massiliense]